MPVDHRPARFYDTHVTPSHTHPRRVVGILLGTGIVLLPYIFSWFTLRKGHSTLSRMLSLTWLSVFIICNVWVSVRPATSVENLTPRTSVIKTQPIATPTASPKNAATLPPADAWTTKESRDIGGAFFIKPYLRQWLKDPDSLQDFEVVNARPDKKIPGSFKVTVFYRARNSFGALVPEERTVTMVYNPTDDTHPWVMIP